MHLHNKLSNYFLTVARLSLLHEDTFSIKLSRVACEKKTTKLKGIKRQSGKQPVISSFSFYSQQRQGKIKKLVFAENSYFIIRNNMGPLRIQSV